MDPLLGKQVLKKLSWVAGCCFFLGVGGEAKPSKITTSYKWGEMRQPIMAENTWVSGVIARNVIDFPCSRWRLFGFFSERHENQRGSSSFGAITKSLSGFLVVFQHRFLLFAPFQMMR